MREPQRVTADDPCPSCGDRFRRIRVATDDEWAAYADVENPRALPMHVDTMAPAKVREHGALYACVGCGYRLRQVETVSFLGAPANRE